MSKKVLLTGAGGFIGSHLAEYLVRLGYQVSAVLRYNSRNDQGALEFIDPAVRKELKVVTGDLRDADFCETILKEPSYVFHLAAFISVPYSYINPMEFVQSNVVTTCNLLNAARRNKKLMRFVHASSSEVYGAVVHNNAISEEHSLDARSPYAASKIAADKLCESFYYSFDIPVTTIRSFNTYGPRQSARALIPSVITQLLSGPEVNIGNLSPRRDLLFVGDAVRGFVEAGLHRSTIGQTIHLGTGKSYTVEETARMISEVMRKEIKLVQEKRRTRPSSTEVYHLQADTSKTRRLTGWTHATELEKGLELTIPWYQSNLHMPSMKFQP